MKIENRIKLVVDDFCRYADWEDRYKELIKIGKNLEELPVEHQIEKFLIKGCQSRAWLKPSFKEGRVYFQASSEAILVKGIIGILVKVYSGSTPEEVLSQNGDFLKTIGISEHLSMNRTNGLASMFKQIQMYAFVYKSLAEKGIMDANDI